jgi:hypothetical protein
MEFFAINQSENRYDVRLTGVVVTDIQQVMVTHATCKQPEAATFRIEGHRFRIT